MTRSYYSQRLGRPQSEPFSIERLRSYFLQTFSHLESEGYFQEDFGYPCVDAEGGFVPGELGADIENEVELSLFKSNLWPPHETIDDWTEEDLFDMMEFLYDHVSKPIERHFHSFASCGWHCYKFSREEGRSEFRAKMNRVLNRYSTGFELDERGWVLSLSPDGMQPLVEEEFATLDTDKVVSRISGAITKFRRHRASVDNQLDAVRDLAAALEYLRPQVRELLGKKDEATLFTIANDFNIRHHNRSQKDDYDQDIWLEWVFYLYLSALRTLDRLIQRGSQENPLNGS